MSKPSSPSSMFPSLPLLGSSFITSAKDGIALSKSSSAMLALHDRFAGFGPAGLVVDADLVGDLLPARPAGQAIARRDVAGVDEEILILRRVEVASYKAIAPVRVVPAHHAADHFLFVDLMPRTGSHRHRPPRRSHGSGCPRSRRSKRPSACTGDCARLTCGPDLRPLEAGGCQGRGCRR